MFLKMVQSKKKRIIALLLSILIIIPLGLSTKFYMGPGQNWANHYLGGVFYEIFFCLLLALFLPVTPPWKIAGWVFAVTVLIEFLQRHHPVWLTTLRRFWLGHLLLGSSYNVWDFPFYLLGCVIGVYWINKINQRFGL
jgi:hypothetical protein